MRPFCRVSREGVGARREIGRLIRVCILVFFPAAFPSAKGSSERPRLMLMSNGALDPHLVLPRDLVVAPLSEFLPAANVHLRASSAVLEGFNGVAQDYVFRALGEGGPVFL